MTRQYPLPLPHSTAMAADDFIVTASNREAVEWINKWPQWPSHCMVVIGPAGSGKSHLLNLWLQNSRGKIVPTAELEKNNAGSLAMSNNVIAIDDADKITGKRDAEVNLFHLYNLLRENKGFLLLTASRPASQWNLGLADLRSRILASHVANIAPPDDDLLTMLLVKQFHDRQLEIGSDVITYLLPRITRTADALRNLVAKLDQASLAEGKPVTIALVKRVFEA